MELERLKAALQERKFEGYLFERATPQVILDIQRRAKSMEEKERAHDIQAILAGVAFAVLYFFWFDSKQPLWSNIGLGLMMAGSILTSVCVLGLYLQGRRIRLDLPRREFLAEERKRLSKRIRILHSQGMWSCVPLVAGVLLYFLPRMKSILECAILVAVIACALGATWWRSNQVHGRALKSLLAEIELELAQLSSSAPAGGEE